MSKRLLKKDDLSDVKIFCIRNDLTLKQFINRAIRNEIDRMGAVSKDRRIRS